MTVINVEIGMSPVNAQLMEQCVTSVENHFSKVCRADTEKSSSCKTVVRPSATLDQ